MASRKVPAERTCSQVRVVKLAGQRQPLNAHTGGANLVERLELTAERSDGGVDGFDEHTLPVQLLRRTRSAGLHSSRQHCQTQAARTSSHVFVSSKIHPSSITSAESLVT